MSDVGGPGVTASGVIHALRQIVFQWVSSASRPVVEAVVSLAAGFGLKTVTSIASTRLSLTLDADGPATDEDDFAALAFVNQRQGELGLAHANASSDARPAAAASRDRALRLRAVAALARAGQTHRRGEETLHRVQTYEHREDGRS